MNAAEMQTYLHTHIPLTQAMGVEVIEVSRDRVRISAPLAPNINHRDTVFGGSASAVAILCAWTLLHVRLNTNSPLSRIVIQENTMHYERPIAGAFTALSTVDSGEGWGKFTATLKKRGRARIAVASVLESDGKRVGILHGRFVAFQAPTS